MSQSFLANAPNIEKEVSHSRETSLLYYEDILHLPFATALNMTILEPQKWIILLSNGLYASILA